jgi:hypothetical protein
MAIPRGSGCKRGPGGANNPYGRVGAPEPVELLAPEEGKEITLYNLQGDKDLDAAKAPTGTSRQAGLRRLNKAANDDPNGLPITFRPPVRHNGLCF